MATLKEYFETDFINTIKQHVIFSGGGFEIEAFILYDFTSKSLFTSFYFPRKNLDLEYFYNFIQKFADKPEFRLNERITLPTAKTYYGSIEIVNEDTPKIFSKFYGEPIWKGQDDLINTGRAFIYSETQFEDNELLKLYEFSKNKTIDLQFRSIKFRDVRSNIEKPLAFISHDSRDKEDIANPIVVSLQKLQCPVWYDEYSLKVGDNLRESIEKGIKECKKCVLVLSPNFLRNNGWTKVEFNSIFTRELIEESNLVLPVWHNIDKKELYDYSPSLVNKVGVNMNLGLEEVVRRLYRAITD